MAGLGLPPRLAVFLLALLCMTLASSGLPLRSRRSPISQEDAKMAQWEVLYPSISLLDWNIQMMTGPEFAEAKAKTSLVPNKAWLPSGQSQRDELSKNWPSDWSVLANHEGKRNIVVGDDAVFREKSKLLTAMERQKWLNSYMQKLLVVDSQ